MTRENDTVLTPEGFVWVGVSLVCAAAVLAFVVCRYADDVPASGFVGFVLLFTSCCLLPLAFLGWDLITTGRERLRAARADPLIPDPETRVDLGQLAPEFAEIIRAFAPRDGRVTFKQMSKWLDEATQFMTQRECYARQQALALDWAAEQALAKSRAAFIASLSAEERGLLEMRLKAQADAEARASQRIKDMEETIGQLRAEIVRMSSERIRR